MLPEAPSTKLNNNWYRHPVSFFAVSAFILLILWPLFNQGVFIDGMLYKTVAVNYSRGGSTFWSMSFTNTYLKYFCEQPPLFFFLLGSYYKVFGVGYFADRVFTLGLYLILLLLVKQLLARQVKSPVPFFLLSFIFLLSVPVICWSYANQVIEPLVCILTLTGLLLWQNYLRQRRAVLLFLFAINLLLLFFTKGFQSCFIILLPFLHWGLSTSRPRILAHLVIISVAFVLCLFGLLRFYEPAARWYDCYYQTRLVLTMNDVGSTTDNHAEIIWRFFTELVVVILAVFCLLTWVSKTKKYPLRLVLKNFRSNVFASSLLICSLAGSLPFALSLVQRGFYLLPAFVCFIMVMVVGLKRYWLFLFYGVERLCERKWLRFASFLLLLCSFCFFVLHASDFKRDKDLYADLNLIEPLLKEQDTVLIETDLWNYVSLHALLYSHKKISLSNEYSKQPFLLTNKNTRGERPSNYRKVNLNTVSLDLWVQTEPSLR